MKELFGGIADRYDRMNRIMSLSLDRRWRRMALAPSTIPPGSDVLDLACGTGDFSLEVLNRFPDAKVTGVDIAPEMLAVARRKIHDSANVAFMEGDAQNLVGIPSGRHSLAVCAFGFRNFPDKARALGECHRVLKPGGELVVLELFRPASRVTGALVGAWLAFVSFLFAHGAKKEYAYLRQSIAGTVSADEFIVIAEEAGFTLLRRRNFMPSATCLAFVKRTD